MPHLTLRYCVPATTAVPATANPGERIAALLTELTTTVLGKRRELTAVVVDVVPASSWFIGGQPVRAPTALLDIKVTEGTNTKHEKAAYVRQVFDGLSQLLGPLAPASYIVIHELRADAWGYQGETQEWRYIQGQVTGGSTL